MTVLELEREGDGWRLHLDGDWSLEAMAQIEAQLRALPGGLRGTLTCDWSRAEAPGIGPAWVLLMRLAGLGAGPLDIRHSGDPPHFLELLQKLEAEPRAAPASEAGTGLEHSVSEVGRWAVLQGTEGRAVPGRCARRRWRGTSTRPVSPPSPSCRSLPS
jgi:hypothetical protein